MAQVAKLQSDKRNETAEAAIRDGAMRKERDEARIQEKQQQYNRAQAEVKLQEVKNEAERIEHRCRIQLEQAKFRAAISEGSTEQHQRACEVAEVKAKQMASSGIRHLEESHQRERDRLVNERNIKESEYEERIKEVRKKEKLVTEEIEMRADRHEQYMKEHVAGVEMQAQQMITFYEQLAEAETQVAYYRTEQTASLRTEREQLEMNMDLL